MNFYIYTCHPNPWVSADSQEDYAVLGAPDCRSSLMVMGTWEERVALLTAWAKEEGCEVAVGERPSRVEDPAPMEDYRPHVRAGD